MSNFHYGGNIRGWEDPLEKGMTTHSSILAWRIPWTEEPDGLQSMESQGVGHDWVTTLTYFLLVVAYHLQKGRVSDLDIRSWGVQNKLIILHIFSKRILIVLLIIKIIAILMTKHLDSAFYLLDIMASTLNISTHKIS